VLCVFLSGRGTAAIAALPQEIKEGRDMRTSVLALVVMLGLLAIPTHSTSVAASSPASAISADLQQQPAQPSTQPSPPPKVDVEVHRSGGAWYMNPVWMAIGAIAVIVLVLLIVVATRGGGTTIVRD
jgi:hypothetical protein